MTRSIPSGVGTLFLGVLGWASHPLNCAHAFLTDCGKKKTRVEYWILSWLAIEIGTLLLLVDRFPAFAIFPVLRLADLSCTLIRVLLAKSQVNKLRTFLLLLVHYGEVVTIFASVYFVEQRLFAFLGDKAFLVNGCPKEITAAQAWYFSLVTGSTLGYGDITPATYVSRALVAFQLLIMLFITLISIPRVFTVNESKPSSKSANGSDVS